MISLIIIIIIFLMEWFHWLCF